MVSELLIDEKLKRANEILEELSEASEFITPVSADDYPLFQKFFDKEKPTYGNTWTYVTQGVYGIGPNKLGYKYYDGENLSMICVYPKVEEPTKLMMFWIRPMGVGIFDKIIEISQEVLDKYDIHTYVKKVFKEDFDYMVSKGFVSADNYPWHSLAPTEDDTYPEQIYNIKKTLEYIETSSRRKNIRKSFLKAIEIEKIHNVRISGDNFIEIALNVTEDFFTEYNKEKHKLNVSSYFDYVNVIKSISKDVDKQIIYLDDKPSGYFITDGINNETTGLYSLITFRKKIPYISDYLLNYIFKFMENKYKYLNIGGSEEEGIYNFKKKYIPVFEQQMYWLTNKTI